MSTPEQTVQLLAPYGRAWAKVMKAFEQKIETLERAELEELITACHSGRWHNFLLGNNYWASLEVERIARAKLNTMNVKEKIS